MTDDARLVELPHGRRFLVVPGPAAFAGRVDRLLAGVSGDVFIEVDDTNVASNTLMRGLGATRVGGVVELVRRGQPVG